DRELGPSEEEGGETSPRVPNEDVNSAGLGKGAGDFSQCESSAQRDDAAGHPNAEERQRSRQLLRDAGRRAEDAGSDRDADDDGNRAPKAEGARKSLGWGGGFHSKWYSGVRFRARAEV